MDHMNKQGFIKMLGHLFNGGPVTAPHDKKYLWPSKGKGIHLEEHPEMVPWDAGALVQNLALSLDARQFFAIVVTLPISLSIYLGGDASLLSLLSIKLSV